MDLLFSKYASPFPLLDGFIQTSRFCEFVRAFVKQKIEDDRWELYLHKVWDKSFAEFCQSLDTTEDEQDMSEDDMEATIQKSMNILGSFNPDKEEGDV